MKSSKHILENKNILDKFHNFTTSLFKIEGEDERGRASVNEENDDGPEGSRRSEEGRGGVK